MLSVGHSWFFLNVVCSVAIVLLCKSIFSRSNISAVSLTLLHYIVTLLVTRIQDSKKAAPTSPTSDTPPPTTNNGTFMSKKGLLLTASFFLGWQVPMSHVSLALNTTATFQLFKLGPMVSTAIIEVALGWTHMGRDRMGAMAVVMFGVLVASIDTIPVLSFTGTVAGVLSMICVSGGQVINRYICTNFNIGGAQLMKEVLPISILMLCVERIWSFGNAKSELMGFTDGSSSLAYLDLLVTCLLATLINVSVPECIKLLSATFYNTVGHVKTVLVVALGTVLFGESMSFLTVVGFSVALAGISMYGWFADSQPSKNLLPVLPMHNKSKNSSGPIPSEADDNDAGDKEAGNKELDTEEKAPDLNSEVKEVTEMTESDALNRKLVTFCLVAIACLGFVRFVATASV